MDNISVVINYCSLEREFLNICLTQCMKFSNDIVVSYGSHFYDGTIEDHAHIEQEIAKNHKVKFVKYEVDKSINLNLQRGVDKRPHAYWHNLARWTGLKGIKGEGWVLFLDVDEIPDGDRVNQWLHSFNLAKNTSYSLANYWYFKSPNYRATEWESTSKVIYSTNISEKSIFGDAERDHLQNTTGDYSENGILGLDGCPLIHHYSWVRSEEILLKKIRSWGHSDQIKDPVNYVKSIFKNKNINDSVHNYKYEYVYNQFSIKINTVDFSYPISAKENDDLALMKKIQKTKTEKDSAALLNLKGLQLLLHKEYASAVEFFAKAIEGNTQKSDYYNNLGIAIYGLGNFDSAIEIFQMSLKINIGNEEALYYLGRSMFNAGKNAEALEYFKQLDQTKAASAECNYYLGCAYMNECEYTSALHCFEYLIKNGTVNEGVLKNKDICLEMI